jgi:hypothetical protein
MEKCKWIGQTYVKRIVRLMPKHIVYQVIRQMAVKEEEDQHMQKLVTEGNSSLVGTRKTINLTPETVTIPGAIEMPGYY